MVDVAVCLLRQRHGVPQRGAEVAGVQALTDGGQSVLSLGQHFLRRALKLARLRDATLEIAVRESEDAVYQVAERGHQLIVVAPHKVAPGEVGVAGLRHCDRNVVSQRVGIVAIQVVGDPHCPVAAGGKLAAFQVEELIRGHVVWKVQPAVSGQHRRPDNRVERNVVLADEVVGVGVASPERLPGVRSTAARGPLL